MNWFKKSQQDITEQYQELMDQSPAVQITGTGQNESVDIPNANYSINARDLLEKVKAKLSPVLQENNVTEIDTSPISEQQAQGLAISHEPGRIHVDVQKIFDQIRQSLPPTAQLDSTQADPNVIQNMVNELSGIIEAELTETIAHESQHVVDFMGSYQQGQPFTDVEEEPAEQFGQQMRQRHN